MSNTAVWFDLPAGRYELQMRRDDAEWENVTNGHEFHESDHELHLRLVVLDETHDWQNGIHGLVAPDGETYEQLKLF